jgi:hypothetical protein
METIFNSVNSLLSPTLTFGLNPSIMISSPGAAEDEATELINEEDDSLVLKFL